jgi:hypothetical protein
MKKIGAYLRSQIPGFPFKIDVYVHIPGLQHIQLVLQDIQRQTILNFFSFYMFHLGYKRQNISGFMTPITAK